jgi:hypothetical protein
MVTSRYFTLWGLYHHYLASSNIISESIVKNLQY